MRVRRRFFLAILGLAMCLSLTNPALANVEEPYCVTIAGGEITYLGKTRTAAGVYIYHYDVFAKVQVLCKYPINWIYVSMEVTDYSNPGHVLIPFVQEDCPGTNYCYVARWKAVGEIDRQACYVVRGQSVLLGGKGDTKDTATLCGPPPS